MKKSYLVASLAGLTLIGLSSMPVSMVGATTEVVSDGQVMFKTDVTRTPAKNPLDPGDAKPGKPTNPTNPTGTATNGTTGPLSLDYASSFTFGEAMISADDAKYYAKPQVFSQDDGKTVDRPNFVQVTDKRGTFEGWTLKVKQEKQFSVKDDDTKELTGAQLKFLNGHQQLISSMRRLVKRKSRLCLAVLRSHRLRLLKIRAWALGFIDSGMNRRWPSQLSWRCLELRRRWPRNMSPN